MRALRREAETEAARLPALLAEARRLAAAVRAGTHAQRREGAGEGFWSYRPYRPGDEPRRIDWRRSARGDEVLIRETEQVRAAIVLVWPDRRPGMRWRSAAGLPLKAERATVLALALASLLGRGGERCGLLGGAARPVTGQAAADRLAEGLTVSPENAEPGPAPARSIPVWVTDALEPAEAWAQRFNSKDQSAAGVLVRIVDPAEADFPYRGRTVFLAPGGGVQRTFGRADVVAADYAEAWRAHAAAVDAAAARAGARVLEHRTDKPAGAALLALWRAVTGKG